VHKIAGLLPKRNINNNLNFHTDDIEIRKAVIALAKARYELRNKKKELRKE
jgi:hypothetical protein